MGSFEVKCIVTVSKKELQIMLGNEDRSNKGGSESADEGHTKRKTEPGMRELRRKNTATKVKRWK